MRKIKFRGKRIDNGEWVVGSLINKIKPTEIEDVFWASLIHDGALTAVEVNPETVGQFTGLHDKNGVEVWEGDIVRCGYGVGQVIYNAGCFMVQWIDDKEAYMEFFFSKKGMYARKDDELFEIIGNVFDNPELL